MKPSQRRLARPSFGGLLATRQGSLAVALVCAICAAMLIFFSLSRYKTQVRTPPTQATVLVATGEIPQGTSGNVIASERLYRSTPVAASQVTPGAISDAAALANERAQSTILPGQQLTSADFSVVSGVAGTLSPTQRAVSVAIDEAHGNTDVLQAGDHVDIYASFNASKNGPTMILLVPDALVLKPASSTPIHSGGISVTGSSLVLAVTPLQAAEISFASDNGKLLLALRGSKATAPTPIYLTQKSILQAALAQATALTAHPNLPSTTTSNGAHR
ncbi:MAG: Flp pilus assembly protein CpaB [Solirubrobacteraceae bacterium]